MQKLFRSLLFVAAAAGAAASATAGELTVKIAGGRATVIARDVPLREILAEWARVGNTKIVNGDKLLGGPVSLELVDMPEKDALDILLRSAAGYMTGPRPPGMAGASLYDRVMILATSKPPPATAFNPPPRPFGRGAGRTALTQEMAQPQPEPEEVDDDDGEPEDQGPMPPPGMIMNPGQFPGQFPGGPNNPNAVPQTMPAPGQMPVQNPNLMQPGSVPGAMLPEPVPGATPPGAFPPGTMPPAAMPPTTSPRPGMLPAQPSPVNPYSPFGRPPGTNGRGAGPGEPDDR
jgi:hypothetical protein